ncbi:MAG: RNA polymerase sigma factor [Opitutales bacterium]|nr:RNA polymerase sigma factor [Opitutales bacterium]
MFAESTHDPWKDWLEEFGPRLLLFARQQARHPRDAEDLLQEACIRVWRESGGGEAVPPLAHFFRALRHTAIDAARREDRRARREQVAGAQEEPLALFQCPLEQNERRASIEAALGELPEDQRNVLVLKIWGEQSFEDVATILDIPAGTAASRYRYALSNLRKILPTHLSA